MYHESCWKQLYGKEVEVCFLCSYHATNPCDGVGVHSKKVAKTLDEDCEVGSLLNGTQYANALNDSNYKSTSVGVGFDKICRNPGTFPKNLQVFGEKEVRHEDQLKYGQNWHLRKYCHIKYYYEQVEDGHTVKHWQPGFIRAELTPGCGQWRVLVIMPENEVEKEQGNFCVDCSNFHQRMVRCRKDKCPIAIQRVSTVCVCVCACV
jgi:hypothetical protein